MKFLSDKLRGYWQRARDFCIYRILHADDPPHRLALGIAIGMFVTFTPTIGLQMLIVAFLAWLFRANITVGLPIVWLTNPATIVPIYGPCYWLGCKLMGVPGPSMEWLKSFSQITELSLGAKLQLWWDKLLDIAAPLWLGCIVVGGTLGIASYYISLFAIRSYRLRRWGQLMPPSLTAEIDLPGQDVDAENSNSALRPKSENAA